MLGQVCIRVTVITRHFFSDEIRLFVWFIGCLQFHLSNYKALVLIIELVNLKGMVPTLYKIACLVDAPRFA